ncbi:hypothetical protein P152DRAFT_459278 [Eremomyces bilateralis CBS 781.70]|uniref:Uncharacterized protein n=1 Tax=Eremomyces bilateralis CBS 781.70 TaxID=1392243 RepID=A0A6G1G1E5_9PEZI|nr:uncharacterized protein P152DRAFT_459278 [Eremomyces bilateralis CBS 781.70]KAF1811802.1 hypothetical protein P152DRAFT_459278 [Eremomyces bilateralis CBS 781.70]
MVHQPYLYGPTNSSFDLPSKPFDPKAVTRASYVSAPPPKPKQDGPLINFNKHPDSYLILPYGQTNAKTMDPRTKSLVKYTRWTQLFLRTLQIFAVIGMLVLVICIKNTSVEESWILRVPVAVDVVVTLYAIYHLCRAAKDRTPGSSASYHFFALVMDTGLIPFYVYIMIASKNNLDKDEKDKTRWETLLSGTITAKDVMTYTWYAAIVNASIHGASDVLDLILLLVFRRITRLPPDMNPLEDNLTSRKSKHKYKNSELTVSSATMSEKRASNMSSVTLDGSPTRRPHPSARDSLLSEDSKGLGVSFMSTRQGDSESIRFSAHNPRTLSQINFPPNGVYQPRSSVHASHADLASNRGSYMKETHSNPPSRPLSSLSPSKRNTLDSRSDAPSPVSSLYNEPSGNNWTVHDSETPYTMASSPSGYKSRPKSWIPSSREKSYAPLSNHARHQSVDNDDPVDDVPHPRSTQLDHTNPLEPDFNAHWLMPQPLRMNPPTPPSKNFRRYGTPDGDVSEGDAGRGYGISPSPTRGDYSRIDEGRGSPSPTRLGGTPKRKYYGDLASATKAVRGGQAERRMDGGGRVVSRSGVDDGDIGTAGYTYGHGSDGYASVGGSRRREVSGKVAEEGRGGILGWQTGLGGLVMRKTSTGN